MKPKRVSRKDWLDRELSLVDRSARHSAGEVVLELGQQAWAQNDITPKDTERQAIRQQVVYPCNPIGTNEECLLEPSQTTGHITHPLILCI